MIRCPRCHHRLRDGGCTEHGSVGGLTGPAPEGAVAASPATPPATLEAWRQGACLAVGGSALVFEASDGARDAVVKWARWRDAAAKRRILREAELLRHAGDDVVPAVLTTGQSGGWPYLVMERLPGRTLAETMAVETAMAMRTGAAITLGAIARAVARLHRRGIVHGDLKPENVFVHGGDARLIDLGIAVAEDASDPRDEGGGTLHYTSPEQLAGRPPRAAADVYALGAIGFELLTGRPPFVGDRAAIEYGHALCRVPRLDELAALGADVERLVVACLAKSPADRPAIDRVIAVLERNRGSRPSLAAAPDGVARTTANRAEQGAAALLWVASEARTHVARLVRDAAGRIVRERPEGTLAAFLWHDHDDPLQAALTVAARLDPGTPTVVHCADVRVRRSGPRLLVHGEAADHAERWRPSTPWDGLLCTTAAADHLAAERVGIETLPGFHRVEDRDRPSRSQVATVPDLIARHGMVDDIASAVAAALRDAQPLLVTVDGDAGSGKSRTLEEIRRGLAAGGARVVVAGGRSGVAGRPAVSPVLAAALADLPGLTALDRLRHCAEAGAVILVDDAHRVEDEVLDLLETATAWERARLAVVVACAPTLSEARPRWGTRATQHLRFALRPLDDAAAVALLRRQLSPARRIPDALIARLTARARGNPGALVGVAREIHRRGLVRRFPDSEEFYIAADELDGVVLEPDRRRRAARQLAELPAGMPAFVQLCAALGPGFDLAEIEAVQRALPSEPVAIDAAAGVAWLTRRGVLQVDGDRWVIADEALREAADAQVADDRRADLHGAALAHCERAAHRSEAERLARVAHHARLAGRRDVAARAFIELARLARLACAYVEAERMASQALETLPADELTLRARALAERGRARRPLALYERARADLVEARRLAAASDQGWLELEALVDEGAICDFTDRLVESAEAIERAAARLDPRTPVGTRARVENWLGVVRARQGRLDEAAALLQRAIDKAEALDDHETLVGSTLMLGGVRRRQVRLDAAHVALDRAIERSEAHGDVFHLTVGLFNRINLWRVLGASENAERDCARAIEIAERHGYGQMEIAGWLNLSEVCLAAGRDQDALDAARRGFAVARRRFGERPPVVATSWLALLEAGHGHVEDAARLLSLIDDAESRRSPLLHLRRTAVAAVTSGAALDEVAAGSDRLEPADRLAFDWFLGRLGLSAPSTPAGASAGTR